ncbi:MAG: hypothetical protein Kow0069_08600 [Promethearchaeota archaeon]
MAKTNEKAEGKKLLDRVMEIAIHRGFLIPTAEIYPDRLAGFFEFGPVGVHLKRHLVELWREMFVTGEINPPVYEIEGAVVLPEQVLVASGHASSFTDPVVSCAKCGETLRADHLVEEATGKFVEGASTDELAGIIREEGLKCPKCGGELEPPTVFNLMLKTRVGPKSGVVAYLRPETAQSIFLAYKRVQQSMRASLPFGIAQVGNSFRNEIAPRQGLIRMRAFNQMEIEVFVDPQEVETHPNLKSVADVKIRLITQEAQRSGQDPAGEDLTVKEAVERGLFPNEYLAYYVGKEQLFYEALGIPADAIRFRHMLPEETPFYSKGNFDVEVRLSVGWKEVVGNAYRTDHDLSTHMKHSKTKLTYGTKKRKFVPHVVEPSFGVERSLYCTLEHCFREKGHDRDWAWFQFPPRIAPYQVHVFPLQRRDGLEEHARGIYESLKKAGLKVLYDHAGSIGKRYARADEIGTPYCVTVDYKTLEEEPATVTIRDRDTTHQVRVRVDRLEAVLRDLVAGEAYFEDLGQFIR